MSTLRTNSVSLLTGTDVAVVRLYYENFGFSIAEIAANLDKPKVVIEALVKERDMVALVKKKEMDDKSALLLEQDLDKQLTLAPFYARAEITILAKTQDVLTNIDADDMDAPSRISMCARALKDLKAAGFTAKMDNIGQNAGVTVQILNTM